MLQIVDYLKARTSTDERGVAAVEYALLIAFIAALIIAAVTTLQGSISGVFTSIAGKL
jgi:Flp pilus assembly pilin Flp